MEIRGDRFVDEAGRSLILRGVNLGGNSKVPVSPDGRTHIKEGFYEGKDVSFVGRPFPLEEADGHFARLAGWGQRFERFLVTWEAVEHEGPGIYDTAYLDYLEGVVDSAARHGISLFIDPHQDVWSRWSGGDGAPLWTLEAIGFEARNFQASGAALIHQEMGQAYPQMQWFSNHLRLACATMFTLFFAGNDFAPGIEVEGGPVQRFLQDHYIAAMREIALRLAKYPNVVGIDSMNEPGTGFIGIGDARVRRQGFSMPGLSPTPWETMLAGEGFPVDVDRIGVRGLGLKVVGRALLGNTGLRAWKDDAACVWRRAGVWDIEGGTPILKDPGRFAAEPGAFNERWLKPFVMRFASEIRAASKATSGSTARFAIFVEGAAQGESAPSWAKGDPAGVVNSTHWYDAFTLSFKLWTGFLAFDTERGKAVIGPSAVRAYFREAFARIARQSRNAMGGVPSLVGEFGLPFDMNGRRGFRTGDFRLQEKALSAYYDALDANLMNATLWNYTADNTHEWGDGWNGEDLSVFCKEDGGGRALGGFVRPYAYATAGRIVEMSFNRRSGEFRLRYLPDATITAPTEVFVPRLQYPEGYALEVLGCVAAERGNAGGEENFESPLWLDLKPEPGTAECVLILKRRC
ncbi:MAG: hypothetical protein CVV53_04075 [Spirochaetae bacterium HGW-Spirochaetae-9]|nr:MAG: hypothetical protein CVV53_04075 [Spirochaetae bacterium HGW-Spirochaetae-9]